MYCHQYPEYLHQAVPGHLLPLVVTFLTDTNNQVRKTSQAALLVLLEQGLVDGEDVEDQVRRQSILQSNERMQQLNKINIISS